MEEYNGVFNKLVRNKIPDIIKQNGELPQIEILSESMYIEELNKKLDEEILEYQESKELEELADALEVIYAICEARGFTIEELHEIRDKKRNLRGDFEQKIFLILKNKNDKDNGQ